MELLNRLAAIAGATFRRPQDILYAFPAPQDVVRLTPAKCRAIGFSHQKVRALLALARAIAERKWISKSSGISTCYSMGCPKPALWTRRLAAERLVRRDRDDP
jgi:3-methyladenine DNA glycosylase/8-oxoguanine DNA glycosylase